MYVGQLPIDTPQTHALYQQCVECVQDPLDQFEKKALQSMPASQKEKIKQHIKECIANNLHDMFYIVGKHVDKLKKSMELVKEMEHQISYEEQPSTKVTEISITVIGKALISSIVICIYALLKLLVFMFNFIITLLKWIIDACGSLLVKIGILQTTNKPSNASKSRKQDRGEIHKMISKERTQSIDDLTFLLRSNIWTLKAKVSKLQNWCAPGNKTELWMGEKIEDAIKNSQNYNDWINWGSINTASSSSSGDDDPVSWYFQHNITKEILKQSPIIAQMLIDSSSEQEMIDSYNQSIARKSISEFIDSLVQSGILILAKKVKLSMQRHYESEKAKQNTIHQTQAPNSPNSIQIPNPTNHEMIDSWVKQIQDGCSGITSVLEEEISQAEKNKTSATKTNDDKSIKNKRKALMQHKKDHKQLQRNLTTLVTCQ